VAYATDDGFHEIQLNGKQLVFLFMAATVVSVVIFLCGVLVGRGVRAERAALTDGSALGAAAAADIAPDDAASSPVDAPAASADPTNAAAPPTTTDDLSYFNRLERQTAPPEELKPSPEEAPEAPAAAPEPVAAQPARQGYAVQLAALNSRTEADAMAKRLASKGYAAYVVTPANGTPAVFRVRVGTFNTRREAETIASKLEKEEQFKPWVTR